MFMNARPCLILSLCLLGAATIGLAGCQNQKTADPAAEPVSMGVVNERCPIMGSPVTADGGTVEYDGYTIGFCCPGCDGPFNDWSDEQKRAFIAESLRARELNSGR